MTNTVRRDPKLTRWVLAAVLLLLTLPALARSQPAGTPLQALAGEEYGSIRARCFHAALQSPYDLPGACRTGLVPLPSAWAIVGLLMLAAVGLYSFIDPEVTEVYVGGRRLLAVGILAVVTVIAIG